MRARPSIGSLALILTVVGLIAGASLLHRVTGDGVEGGDSGWARVVRVVDGDTVILAGLGSSRIVGVDTPETVKPDTPVECFGPRASAFSKHVLGAAGRVRYRVAVEPVDAYGRRLVYLWLPGGRFFNALLVRRGLARPLPFPPNTRYAPLLRRLAERAARRGRGLWGRC
jgi:micrococcal nuclease